MNKIKDFINIHKKKIIILLAVLITIIIGLIIGINIYNNNKISEIKDTSGIVYITDTGNKYHKNSCKYLKKSKNEITLNDAIKKGYTPCSKCYSAKEIKALSEQSFNNL